MSKRKIHGATVHETEYSNDESLWCGMDLRGRTYSASYRHFTEDPRKVTCIRCRRSRQRSRKLSHK